MSYGGWMVTTDLDQATRRACASAVIAADRRVIFDILADPAMHPSIDGGQTVRAPLANNPRRLSMGATFGMSMRRLAPYRIRNTVVEWDEPRLLAWRHFGGHRWRYELSPATGGTLVTETFDWSTSHRPRFIERAGYPERNLRGMAATLDRLAALAAAASPPATGVTAHPSGSSRR